MTYIVKPLNDKTADPAYIEAEDAGEAERAGHVIFGALLLSITVANERQAAWARLMGWTLQA